MNLIIYNKKKRAFSLIELMVVLVILGVVAAVAVPSYQKYVQRSKMAEAYTTLGTLRKTMMKGYEEDQYFPVGVPINVTYFNLIVATYGAPGASMHSSAMSLWGSLAPVTPGTPVNFTYHSHTGRFNAAGAFVSGYATNSAIFKLDDDGDARCMGTFGTGATNITARTFGAPTTLSGKYDYAAIFAMSPLKGLLNGTTIYGAANEEGCFYVAQFLEANPSQTAGVRSSAPIEFAYSD